MTTHREPPGRLALHVVDLALWVHRRIEANGTARASGARVFGLVVVDAARPDDGGVRALPLGDGRDVAEALAAVDPATADVDALALVCRRCLPEPDVRRLPGRPFAFVPRRAATVVAVVDDHGASCAVRYDDDPAHVVAVGGTAGPAAGLAALLDRVRGRS